jgi:hypothetical protein
MRSAEIPKRTPDDPSSWGTNTWSLFARQGGESLQPGHSWSDRSNSSDTDFEGQIGHRQPGHSGTEACCVSAPARRRVTKCQDTSSASATTFRSGNLLAWQCEPSPARLGAWVDGCARSRSTLASLGVGCVCTQPTTAFKPKTLYNLIFPPTTPFTKRDNRASIFIHSSVFRNKVNAGQFARIADASGA